MTEYERIRKQQRRQAARNAAYREELARFGGPRKVVKSGRAKGYFWTRLVERMTGGGAERREAVRA